MAIMLVSCAGGGLALFFYLCIWRFRFGKKKKEKPPSVFFPRGVIDSEGGFWEIIRYR